MKAKLGMAAILLVSAAAFGGTGVFATYEIVTMLYDGVRARDWTAVQAAAVSEKSYRYRFDGRDYESDRWGLERLGGSDNIDSWQRDMRELVATAFKKHRPITVYVNPAEPSQAVIDRNIRWKQLLLFVPFAICFGGVGVGALWMMFAIFRDSPKEEEKEKTQPAPRPARRVTSNLRGAAIGRWLFAIFWNGLSMPVAFAFVPDAVQKGDWLALLILIFPVVGVFLLWSAISSTISALRHGAATLDVFTAEPRPGVPLQGSIQFARGVTAGEPFRVQLECINVRRTSNSIENTKFWSKECAVQAAPGASGTRVDFRFDVPANVPHTFTDERTNVSHKWRIEAQPASQHMGAAYGFDVALLPPAESTEEFTLANDPPLSAEAKELFDKLGVNASEAKKRAAFAQLTPEEQQAISKAVRWVPSIKAVVIAIVVIVMLIEWGPTIFNLIGFFRGQ